MADKPTYEELREENEALKDANKKRLRKKSLDEIKLDEEVLKLTKQLNDALVEQSEIFEANDQTRKNAAQATLDEAKRNLQAYNDQIAAGGELNEVYKEHLVNTIALQQANIKSIELQAKNRDQFAQIATALTGIDNRWKRSTWGMLLEPEGWAGLSQGIAQTITPMNMLGSAVLKVGETTKLLALAQDNAIAEMNKMTSAAPGLEDQLVALEHEFSSSGVSASEAGQAIGTLFQEVSDFNRMGPETQKELADTTAVLNELGVGMGTTASIAQLMTKTFGQSGKEAAATSRELFSFAQSIGMSADEVAQNFASAGPAMAAFGQQGVDTFKRLQAASKQSGLAIDRMLSIVEKFDRFDSAAESVGQLNAILGGPFLSSLDMVTTTDPTERMQMLSEAVNQSGKSFDEMSYYQRKALAEAMGLQDVAELALVMRDGFDAAVPAQEQSQEALAAQALQAKEFQTVQEEMMQTARAFAVSLRPLVKGFKTFLDGVQKLNDAFGGYLIPTLTITIASFVSLRKAMGFAHSLTNLLGIDILKNIPAKIKDFFATKAQAEVTEELNDAQDGNAGSMARQGKAAGAAAIQMIAFGFAVMLIGAGVAIAALGVAALAYSFSLMDPLQILASAAAIAVFMGGMVAMVAILAALVAGPQAALTAGGIAVLLSIGAAVLLIGGAVFLAATGLALLVSSFALLFKVADPTNMLAFTVAFAGFVGVLYMMLPLASFFPLLLLVLGAVAASFVGMAYAMSLMDFSNFEPLAKFFTSLATLATDASGSIADVADGIAKITEEINKLETEKAVNYSAVLDSVVASKSVIMGGNASPAAAAMSANNGQPVEIILKVKETQFHKVVGKIVNNEFKMEGR